MTTEEHVPVPAQLDALERGAFASLPGWRAIAVDGCDMDVAPRSRDRRRRRSAGRAEPTLASADRGRSDPGGRPRRAPRRRIPCCSRTRASAIDELLGPYVLSSDVALTDRSDELVVVAVLGRGAFEDGDDADALVLSPRSSAPAATCCSPARPSNAPGIGWSRPAPSRSAEALETWRIRRGAADGADFGRRAPGGGRSRVHDRLHEGMLPRPGVRGEGQEPRAPTSGPPRRPIRRAPPSRSPSSPTGVGGRDHERSDRRPQDGRDRSGCAGRQPPRSLHGGRAAPYGRALDISGDFASATWGFVPGSPTTPSPAWSLRAIPFGPGATGTGRGRKRYGAHRTSPIGGHRRVARPVPSRRVAGTVGLLRHRPRRLLPDLRGGSRPRPRLLQRLHDPRRVPRVGAEERERYGVWGGLTEQQRRRVARQVA